MQKNSLIRYCFGLCVLLLMSCQNRENTYLVTKYGAIGDSTTVNTDAIQQAVDACFADGGGKVVLKDGVYVSGTVLLKDNVHLYIEEGASLIGSNNPLDYKSIDPFTDAVGQQRGKCLVGAEGANNIGISGKGTIDGRGKQFLSEQLKKTMVTLNMDKSELGKYVSNRPFLIRFVRSTAIQVKDVHLRQPAAWTLHFFQCSNIHVDGVDIYSHAHKNNDGIDMDSSSDALIENCHINAGDDAICFKTTSPVPTQNIEVRNCRLKSDWGTIKFGTESMGDFKNIRVTKCYVYDTKGGGIKILSVDGANIDNIVIDSIQMEDVDMPLFIRLGERLRTYRDAPKQAVGSITNVSIRNVIASTRSMDESRVSPPSGIFITGTPHHKIGSVNLENIKITLPGGGLTEHIERVIAEDETRYPEFSFFGVSPASGIYARHLNSLKIENVQIMTQAPDARPGFVKVNVDDVNIKNASFNE